MWSYTYPVLWGVRVYVESRTEVSDGKRRGFPELHIESARTGGRRLGARVVPPIPETMFGRDAGHKRSDEHVTRASDAMDRSDGQQAQSQSPTARPRVPVAEQARAGRTGRGPSIPAPGYSGIRSRRQPARSGTTMSSQKCSSGSAPSRPGSALPGAFALPSESPHATLFRFPMWGTTLSNSRHYWKARSLPTYGSKLAPDLVTTP